MVKFTPLDLLRPKRDTEGKVTFKGIPPREEMYDLKGKTVKFRRRKVSRK